MAALSAIRTSCKIRANDQNARILSNANYDIVINEALEEWVNEVEDIRQENAYAVTAKQLLYTAPTDLIRVYRAEFVQSGYVPLKIVNSKEMESDGAFDLQSAIGVSQSLFVEGVNAAYNFRLWPAPSTTSKTSTINDAGGISSSDTEVIVTDSTKFRSPAGWVLIESEKVLYQDVDATTNTLKLLKRGMGGTTAAAHADTTTLTQMDLHVEYSRRAASLSADTSVPEIDGAFHKYLIAYVVNEVLKLDGRVGEAQAYERMWVKGLERAKAITRNKQWASPHYFQSGGY